MRLSIAIRGGATAAALCAGVAAAAFWAPAASAEVEFCPPGEGAGQCGVPSSSRGLAVDHESDRLYVADEANNRVDVFEVDEGAGEVKFLFAFGFGVADGSTAASQTCGPSATPPTAECFKGIAGEGAGQLDHPTSMAVDNSGSHAIYVGEPKNLRVQKFDAAGEFVWTVGEGVDKTDSGDLCTKAEGHTCGKGAQSSGEGGFFEGPIAATGPTGILYVLDSIRKPGFTIEQRLQRFEASGAQIAPQVVPLLVGTGKLPRGLAVDAAGNAWVTSQSEGLRKYCAPGFGPCGGPFDAATDFRSAALTIDASGEIYAGQRQVRDKALGSFNTIAAFDPASGAIEHRFAYTPFGGGSSAINGLAAHASGLGELFFSRADQGITYTAEPPAGPVAAAPSPEVKAIGSARADVAAEVNAEGNAPTGVHFEYVDEATYLKDIGELGPGHGFDHAAKAPEPDIELGFVDFDLHGVEALLGCPDPASEAGEPGNTCLTPETTYRWRVAASNGDGAGGGPVEGEPFETNPAPQLGEAFATKVGADTARLNGEINPNGIPAFGYFEYVEEAAYEKDIAEGGDGFAAASQAPKVSEGQAPLDFGAGEAFLTRGVQVYPLEPGTSYRWRLVADSPLIEPIPSEEVKELHTFALPEVRPCPANEGARIGAGALLPDCRAYEMVSPLDKGGSDIRVAISTLGAPAVLEQSADSGGKLAYGSLRSFGGAASAPYTSQYIAERVAGAGWETHPINTPRGKPIFSAGKQFDTEFKAFSDDLCEAWLTTFAEPPLAPGAVAGYSNLYRRDDELCTEDGKAGLEAPAPLVEPPAITGADFRMDPLGVSADGERAIFATNGKLLPEGSEGQSQLYEHARGTGLRFVCILPEGGGPTGGSCTAGSATANDEPGAGQRAISSDGQTIFWSAPGSGEGRLYARIEGTQTAAVSKAAEAAQGTSKSRFWGAAGDGSAAIFTSGSLGTGEAKLYRFGVAGETTSQLVDGVSGVMDISEDASRVYFVSGKVLSGEETNGNGDKAQAGEANLYLREGGGGIEFIGTLVGSDEPGLGFAAQGYRATTARVSPDGAHALFASTAPLTGYDNRSAVDATPTREIYLYSAETNELLCVSCNPSGARPAGAASIPFWETGMHGARVLAEDGARAYFESADALAARDTNGKVDVYEWEEPGAGSCDAQDPAFSAPAAGCVELLSSGLGAQDSRFVESDPSGENVFFATAANLLPQDFGGVDIYDARINGGLPVPAPIKPPCEGDDCRPQITAPEEPTPASEAYAAPPEGAATGKPAPRCAKGKHRTRGKGKARCAAKHKKHRRAKR